MKPRPALLALCLAQAPGLPAQENLIFNHNFDSVTACPYPNDICQAPFWFQPAVGLILGPGLDTTFTFCFGVGSTDIYHVCANNPMWTHNGVPSNLTGFQYPRSGRGYAGFTALLFYYGAYGASYGTNDYREYLETSLKRPMTAGKKYCISWYQSLMNDVGRGCNGVGAYFSRDTLKWFGAWQYIPLTPHVENTEPVADTLNWVLFHRIYTAEGGEKYMTVGNFRPGALTQLSEEAIHPQIGWCAYYLDDFGVHELPEAEAGPDKWLCPAGGAVKLEGSCTGCWSWLGYRWRPAEGLSDSTAPSPWAWPSRTTTYYLSLVDPTGQVPCMQDVVDSVTVYVCPAEDPAPHQLPEPPGASPHPPFGWELQPTPGADALRIVFHGLRWDALLRLYDVQGRLLLQAQVPAQSTSYEADVSRLANAPYVVALEAGPHSGRRKWVKLSP